MLHCLLSSIIRLHQGKHRATFFFVLLLPSSVQAVSAQWWFIAFKIISIFFCSLELSHPHYKYAPILSDVFLFCQTLLSIFGFFFILCTHYAYRIFFAFHLKSNAHALFDNGVLWFSYLFGASGQVTQHTHNNKLN